MAIFTKLIKCHHCGANYKSKLERGTKRTYICTNYTKKLCKHRYAIEEEFLLELIEKRYERKLTEQEIRDIVDYIEVYSKRTAKDKNGKTIKLYKLNINFKYEQLPIIIREDFLQL